MVVVVNRSPGSNKLAWDLTGDRDEEDDDAAAPLRSLAAKRTERRSEAENESPHLHTPLLWRRRRRVKLVSGPGAE